METSINYRKIKGWNIDTNPDDEPTYPMKKYTGDDHKRIHWQRPSQQKQTVEILKSTERPALPAVYGTALPPSGLSGAIRRFAYKYSENRFRHWLPLLMADRIDVVEGIFSDLIHGRIPNLVGERGWGALWKYNRPLLMRKIAVRLLVAGAVAGAILYARRDRD
jgi:hypothetical protein